MSPCSRSLPTTSAVALRWCSELVSASLRGAGVGLKASGTTWPGTAIACTNGTVLLGPSAGLGLEAGDEPIAASAALLSSRLLSRALLMLDLRPLNSTQDRPAAFDLRRNWLFSVLVGLLARSATASRLLAYVRSRARALLMAETARLIMSQLVIDLAVN